MRRADLPITAIILARWFAERLSDSRRRACSPMSMTDGHYASADLRAERAGSLAY